MDHIAIMKKSWGLTEKIRDGRKKIESRWYLNKYRPWGVIKAGDTIYFKNSGEPVKLKAEVSKVVQFANLTPSRVKAILNEYGKDDGLDKDQIPKFFEKFRNKKYCLLMFLENPNNIRPFEIDKTGFGAMSAWITIGSISKIKRNSLSIKNKIRTN